MKYGLGALLMLVAPVAAFAQVVPVPAFDDPRFQTVSYDAVRPVRLVAFPAANLTVMLLPGDRITRVVSSDSSAFDVRITGSRDSLNIAALRPGASATLRVETSQRSYAFDLETGQGLTAAYIVRFVDGAAAPAVLPPAYPAPFDPTALIGEYRLSGDRALRPARIGDDGRRTYIQWGEYQSLPAVFGIGPTGEEEVVDGYMRDGTFTIDRVYGELVFRIDDEKAKARRREERKAR
jgi:type IV secretion system protein VirB9